MKSLITLVVGLAIGGAGGVWYGGHHPEAAATEEHSALQADLQFHQAAKDQLDKEIAKRQASPDSHGLLSLETLQKLSDEQKTDIQNIQQQLGAAPEPAAP
jgi:hypothetical protein